MFATRLAQAFFIAALLADVQGAARAATLSRVGPSLKVCQLTGDVDWMTNLPTAARTLANFGMDAADLGAPVDTGGDALYFLFGDTWPPDHPPGSQPAAPPDDATGRSGRELIPNPDECVGLTLATSAPQSLARPAVTPPILQGFFNVPSGGVFEGGSLYTFFWTDHCAVPQRLDPSPGDPLVLPATGATCAELPSLNSVGRSVLAQSSDGGATYTQTGAAQMPSGFVYVNAVDATRVPDLAPASQRLGVFITGTPRYRASVPYLALAAPGDVGDPEKWKFLAGMVGGAPNWISRTEWESGHNASGRWVPPAEAQIYRPLKESENCIGEHSLTFNAPLGVWLLSYGCGPEIVELRFAPAAWGPWSPPTVLLRPLEEPAVICTLIMNFKGCAPLVRRNYWPKFSNGATVPGIFYAPYIVSRYTRDASLSPMLRRATIYWLVSTWNPYAVVMLKTTLQLSSIEGLPLPRCRDAACEPRFEGR